MPEEPLISFIRKNLFIIGLLAAVGLAFLFPRLGADDGPLQAGLIANIGVMVIFFLQGLSLKTRELAAGFRDLRVHGFVQGWIFLLSPMVLFSAGFILRALGEPGLGSGFFFLGLIPTTISSAVAFTTAAGGNVATAIFNTTLSNVLGVFWVPVGCLLLFSAGGGLQAQLIGPLLLKLTWLILVPLAVGQGLRPVLSRWPLYGRVSPGFKTVNHGIILFIVFTAFSGSVLNETWNGVAAGSLLVLLVLTAAAVLIIHTAVWLSGGWVLQSHGDRITALFCGSQKTLAAGAPMAMAIFQDDGQIAGTSLSLILLPLLCYHPLQLFLAAFLLPRIGR
jgi:sodium/bile acid cotransporter 7